ncbi:MAG: Spy/CpxP family protein refolding chaperone [Azoarcus sp.]|jgi:hypothetical protein|nr:Spy/CpxP family protein refolding chaperone [Azoarcus sp.]
MKPWIKTSLVAALAVTTLFGGTAMAQPGRGGQGWGGGGYGWNNASPEQVKERMNKRMEVHLARLELALALTPEQRPAWADFKKAAEARADTMLKEMENRRNAGVPKTAIERMERAEEFNKKRAGMLADMRKSVETFYSKLSQAQKTVFDAETAHFMQPMRGGGKMMGGPGCMMGGSGCMMGGPGCMTGTPDPYMP